MAEHPVLPTIFCIELQLSSPSFMLVQQSTHSFFVDAIYNGQVQSNVRQNYYKPFLELKKRKQKSQPTMASQKNDYKKDLSDLQVSDSPRFGGQVQKAGKYGQPQQQFINESKKDPKVDASKIITKQELQKHKSKASAWISLKGIVYDVTDYIRHHPGGDILLQGCGAQSQKLFNEHHSWVNAKNILSNCILGHLEGP